MLVVVYKYIFPHVAFAGHWSVWASNDHSLQSSVLCWEWTIDQVSKASCLFICMLSQVICVNNEDICIDSQRSFRLAPVILKAGWICSFCPAAIGWPGTTTTGTLGNRCFSLSVSKGRRPTSSWQPSPCRLTSAISNETSTLGNTLNLKRTSPHGWVCLTCTAFGTYCMSNLSYDLR